LEPSLYEFAPSPKSTFELFGIPPKLLKDQVHLVQPVAIAQNPPPGHADGLRLCAERRAEERQLAPAVKRQL